MIQDRYVCPKEREDLEDFVRDLGRVRAYRKTEDKAGTYQMGEQGARYGFEMP